MMAKPLIVTDHVGAKYMVTEYNGIIVESDNADSLKNALMNMIDNKDVLFKMRGTSRELRRKV